MVLGWAQASYWYSLTYSFVPLAYDNPWFLKMLTALWIAYILTSLGVLAKTVWGLLVQNCMGIEPETYEKVKEALDCFDQIETIVYEPYFDLASSSCTVCLGEYQAEQVLKVLPCFHTYHSECIKEWFHKNNVCPVC